AAGLGVLALAVLAIARRRRRDLGSSADRATFDALHTASLAAPSLREGLTPHGAQRAVRHLRTLLGTSAVALTDRSRTLAVDGISHHHAEQAVAHVQAVLHTGATDVLGPEVVSCGSPDCPVRAAVACAVVDGDAVVGALIAYGK